MKSILDLLGFRRSPPAPSASDRRTAELEARQRRVRARYDAAQTSVENAKHWAAADGLSAVAANARDVRRTLRNRSRYEVANNGYADGIGQTLANDCVGTGPRLQIRTGNAELNKKLEALWAEWSRAIDLERSLWTMRLAKYEDGEAFALLVDNKALRTRVKIDLRLVEADQVSSPLLMVEDSMHVDGIVCDAAGNPVQYHILRSHPGDPFPTAGLNDFDTVSASNVLHYFRARRPGQKRGVPEITSAVSLFAQLRRYTFATIAAAEVAADHALVIESAAPADSTGNIEAVAFDTVELEPRMATVLPEGFKLGQAKPEQPTTTYGDFKRQILTEIARPLNMPYNVAAGDSSSYNYASGRLDHQVYFKAIDVERSLMERCVLDPLFRAWFDEAVRLTGVLPQELRTIAVKVETEWLWDGPGHVDPVKEATAQEIRLRNHTSTLADEFGREGQDWEKKVEQRSKELARMKELGLPLPGATAPGSEREREDEDAPR